MRFHPHVEPYGLETVDPQPGSRDRIAFQRAPVQYLSATPPEHSGLELSGAEAERGREPEHRARCGAVIEPEEMCYLTQVFHGGEKRAEAFFVSGRRETGPLPADIKAVSEIRARATMALINSADPTVAAPLLGELCILTRPWSRFRRPRLCMQPA
ncbi:hypothetical protein AAFF_G00012890 [Aldrovandia affinis]|uniref:Uncharacterized protein n=1 Tax=Aldrovandia affinis TaxID=143900 RepID=A0AAD7S902_9TELE|nr:hypothetical protein AAFF_G00012890 [Aldrovandia affinis]